MGRWLLAVASFLLLIWGCAQTEGTDSTSPDLMSPGVLSFAEPVVIGNPANNPSDPYMRTGPNGKVFLSWTEEAESAEGRNVLSWSAN